MGLRHFLVAIILAFASLCFGFDHQMVDCQVQITMADGDQVPSKLRLQLFDKGTRLFETAVPASGRVSLPPLIPGEYRVQVDGTPTNFLTAGPLHADSTEPCKLGISIAGHPDSRNRLVDDDLDIEDLRISAKARAIFENAFSAFQAGNLESARQEFLEATKLAPKLSRTYNALGIISDQLGNRTDAKRCFEKALELNPRSRAALLNLAKLSMLEQQYGVALSLLERLRLGTRDVADNHAMEAEAYFKLGKFAEAIREAQAAHTLPHLNWPNVHVIAAESYEALHQPQAAVQEYQLYIEESTVEPLRVAAAEKIRSLNDAEAKQPLPPMNSFLPK